MYCCQVMEHAEENQSVSALEQITKNYVDRKAWEARACRPKHSTRPYRKRRKREAQDDHIPLALFRWAEATAVGLGRSGDERLSLGKRPLGLKRSETKRLGDDRGLFFVDDAGWGFVGLGWRRVKGWVAFTGCGREELELPEDGLMGLLDWLIFGAVRSKTDATHWRKFSTSRPAGSAEWTRDQNRWITHVTRILRTCIRVYATTLVHNGFFNHITRWCL
jgi:hypothetical protein